MGILKTAIIGAAVYAGVKYLTKKDPISGRSVIDDLAERAPEWMEKAKQAAGQAANQTTSTANNIFK
ncbi:hypothetical protein [Pedobacter rhizosphaerae]|uniref:YtxH-like protein n=1 Tax=Pedobacter rhizosphaerae TaxID=390241 RepID=A0A1H9SK02_9SPHI|nr:hypothetical protein [Pedobacter rhizosphaerae]SER84693.1 hypothetical protein SAMN04488023_11835 [Pedobacter rhizosphaerae]